MTTARLLLVTLPVAAVALLVALPMVVAADQTLADRARTLVTGHVAKADPWKSAPISPGGPRTRPPGRGLQKKEEAQNRIDAALADPNLFQELKALKSACDKGELSTPCSPARSRCCTCSTRKTGRPDLLRAIVAKANAVEKAFNVYRAKVDGRELADSEVRKVLKESKNSERRRAVWEASKKVGDAIAADLKELVTHSGTAWPSSSGSRTSTRCSLFLNEQDGAALVALFDELDSLTREPVRIAKAEIDERLAADCGTAVANLRPWHYNDPFFQESPAVFAANLDAPFAKRRPPRRLPEVYASIGLPIDDVNRTQRPCTRSRERVARLLLGHRPRR